MPTQDQAKHGEFRTLTLQEIASGVMRFRAFSGWKQLTLALEAGVSERTIQRIERGQQVDDDTLLKVAKALRLPEDTFVGPRYMPTLEEARADVLSTLERIQTVDLQPISSPQDIDTILNCPAHLIDDSALDDARADKGAEFKDSLEDSLQAYSSLSSTERLAACRELFTTVQEIDSLGHLARFGIAWTDSSFKIKVAFVIFIKKDDWHRSRMTQLVVPKSFNQMLRGEWT